MGTAELVINGISAAGAVGAALVALGIATKDRQDRTAERHAADRAQARLVLVVVRTYVDSSYYHLDIVNHGDQPVLDVVLDRVLVSGHDYRWKPAGGTDGHIRVVKPEREEAPRTFSGQFVDPVGRSVAVEHENDLGNSTFSGKPDVGLVVATITFTDTGGNTWSTDTEGTLTHRGTAD